MVTSGRGCGQGCCPWRVLHVHGRSPSTVGPKVTRSLGAPQPWEARVLAVASVDPHGHPLNEDPRLLGWDGAGCTWGGASEIFILFCAVC